MFWCRLLECYCTVGYNQTCRSLLTAARSAAFGTVLYCRIPSLCGTHHVIAGFDNALFCFSLIVLHNLEAFGKSFGWFSELQFLIVSARFPILWSNVARSPLESLPLVSRMFLWILQHTLVGLVKTANGFRRLYCLVCALFCLVVHTTDGEICHGVALRCIYILFMFAVVLRAADGFGKSFGWVSSTSSLIAFL